MLKVSVIVPVYNHGRYIERTINSILMQKVDFDIEVLIGEDCSNDNSREVLKSMQSYCPHYFHFFYRERNYGAEKNFADLFSRITGDYFVILEGDDYWTYEYKLQKQVDFLEKHPNYVLCSHNTQVVDEDSKDVDTVYPECKDNEYTLYHYRMGQLPGQTASNLYRNYYRIPGFDISLESVPFTAGDRRRAFECVVQGKVYCIQEKWACYRYVSRGSTSFSSMHKQSESMRNRSLNFYKEMIIFAQKHNNEEAILAAEELYFLTFLSDVKRSKRIGKLLLFCKAYSTCKYKLPVLRYMLSKGHRIYRMG